MGGYSDTSGGSYSGMGEGGGGSCFSLDICPDIIITLIAAAAAAGFYLLYVTIQNAGRRRRRSAGRSAGCECGEEQEQGREWWAVILAQVIMYLGNIAQVHRKRCRSEVLRSMVGGSVL